jgi:hypothetical protein
VWDRGHIPDQANREPVHLQSPDRCFSTHTRPFHPHLRRFHSLLHRLSESILSSKLCREGSALPRTLETLSSSTRRSDDIAVIVGDGNDRVVEGGLNVDDTRWNVLLFFLGLAALFCSLDHFLPLAYFFLLPMTALRGPFLVLALVLVLWPLTGNPFLCLKPR